jgi:dihydroorotate dehydrogenase (fumarate)
MPDLTTTYLGLPLKNPLVVAASPLSRKVDRVRRLEESGAAAVVMYSLFEEEIRHESQELDYFLNRGTHHYAEALNYYPEMDYRNIGPDVYLEHLRALKEAVSIPVIASLNGVSTGGWLEYARMIEQAGADALELNMYYIATDPSLAGARLEEIYVELVRAVRAQVKIPVAVKVGQFFSSTPHMAGRLVEAGADGLVLFNRFFQPEFDLAALEVVPNLTLSESRDLRLPLRWVAILYGRIQADLALTSGVHTAMDTLKAMMAGAKVVQLASALLQHGSGRLSDILADMEGWME